MKRKIASLLVLLLITLNILGSRQIKNTYSATLDPSLDYTIKLKVYFNGSVLAESTGEFVSPNPNMMRTTASVNFTATENSVVVHHRVSILLPSEFSFIGLSGNGSYAHGSASVKVTIQQPFPDMEDASAQFDINRTVITATANTTAVYGGLLGLNNDTVKALIDSLEAGGLNQTYVNSTVYAPTNGKIECTKLTINVVNGTSSAFITLSLRLEGDIFLGLVCLAANLTGQPFPSPGQQATISSMIDNALNTVVNSSFIISSDMHGEVVFFGTTYLAETFDSDLNQLKNQVLENFLTGITGYTFLHSTNLRVSNMSITYSGDTSGQSWKVRWLFMNPPVNKLNATDFDIPGLFEALGGLGLPSNNLTFTIEGDSNSTHHVVVIIPLGAPPPVVNDSATWRNVMLGNLEGIRFRIAPILAPPFLIFSYNTMLWFASLTGVTAFVIVLSAMYRRRFALKQPEPAGPITRSDEQPKK